MRQVAAAWALMSAIGCIGEIGEIGEIGDSAPENDGGGDAANVDAEPEAPPAPGDDLPSDPAAPFDRTALPGIPSHQPCPHDMVLAGNVCIDRFEAPNIAGAEPLAMQTAHDGEAWCSDRGKRLCTDQEWIAACEGETQTLYPYGNEHVPHRCNDDKIWRVVDWAALGTWPSPEAQAEASSLYQADPSGSRADCVSATGAYDLTGNVAEWVVRTLPGGEYDHVMKGCYWAGCYGGTLPNCTFKNPAHPGHFRSYEAGFRCCRNADTAP